nr:hypothetical protein [Tanacetum cinerariifolium]
MLEDPYVEVALQAPPSPDYIVGPEEPEQAPPLPDYVPGPEHADDEIVAEDQLYAEDASPNAQSTEYVPESDLEAHPEDDDDEDPEEDPVDYPADGGDGDDDEEGSSEDDEDDDMDIEADEEEEEEHPAPADSIPFPPLPPILSPPSPVLSPAPPPSPIRSLSYRAAMIRLRAKAASTSHSPPLPPPFILSPTRSDAPSSGTPLLLPISASTLSPPLQPPSASRKEDRPEVTLPPRKRLDIALGPGYEVGESSSAAARPTGGLRTDYGFVATMDREIMRDLERGWLWDHRLVGRDSGDLTGSTKASDLVRGEVMSLRTTVLSQMTEIRELHAADRRRQIVISKMPRADHRRSIEIIELRTALQG